MYALQHYFMYVYCVIPKLNDSNGKIREYPIGINDMQKNENGPHWYETIGNGGKEETTTDTNETDCVK